MIAVLGSQPGTRRSHPEALDLDGRLDPSVLDRLAQHDRATLDAALRALFPDVRRRMFHMLGPRSDLDDAVQDALVEIARALPRFEARSSLRTFATRIVVRTAYRHFGRAKEQPLELVAVADVVDPESRAASREALRRLYRCLAELPEKRRVAFVLCCIEGMTPAEAAAIEGIPSLVMRSRLSRARDEVLRRLDGDEWLTELIQARGGA